MKYRAIHIRFLFLAATAYAAFASALSAANHEVGGAVFFGYQSRYGGDYRTANNPRGIYLLQSSGSTVTGSAFGEAGGISGEVQVNYIFLRRFFAMTGGSYTAGLKKTAKFPMRDPITNSLYLDGGTTEVPTNGSVRLSHISIPLTLGFVVPFWDEVRLFLGVGAAYNLATMDVSFTTADNSIEDFAVHTRVKPKFLTYHALLMGEYTILGAPTDKIRIALNMGLQMQSGKSKVTADVSEGDLVPATAGFPLKQKSPAAVDLTGFRVFWGATVYFFMR